MANRTDPVARNIKGTNPQFLIEKIVRIKILESPFWLEHCFALTAETLVDKAVELKYAGGTWGGTRKPTDFLCLVLKMLQIQPAKEIVAEFILNDDYKYVRLLGAFYMRLTGKPAEVYQFLEPLLNDNRRVRLRTPEGGLRKEYMDQLVDDMLQLDHVFDIALPHLPARHNMEAAGLLGPRASALELSEDDEEREDDKIQPEEEGAGRGGEAGDINGPLPLPGNHNNHHQAMAVVGNGAWLVSASGAASGQVSQSSSPNFSAGPGKSFDGSAKTPPAEASHHRGGDDRMMDDSITANAITQRIMSKPPSTSPSSSVSSSRSRREEHNLDQSTRSRHRRSRSRSRSRSRNRDRHRSNYRRRCRRSRSFGSSGGSSISDCDSESSNYDRRRRRRRRRPSNRSRSRSQSRSNSRRDGRDSRGSRSSGRRTGSRGRSRDRDCRSRSPDRRRSGSGSKGRTGEKASTVERR